MTATLAKAILVRLEESQGSGKNAPVSVRPEPNGAFEVQFNPTSLKMSRQNNVDSGGSTTQTQRRQNPSSQPATLSFDLEFDTAESGQDVRAQTHIVRQFVEPSAEKPTDPPPPVRFIWGTFTFNGIVTQLTEDIDYFAPNGTPLRAKASVTITEKNPEWEAKLEGSAARDDRASTDPGGGGGQGSGPGTRPARNPTTTAVAQSGESLQQLLTRLNADPATWRAAMAGLDSPLTLAAGAQVQLGAQVSAGVGIGVSAGFAAGAEVSATATLAGALGVSGGAGFAAGARVAVGAGFAAGAGAGFAAGGVAAGAEEVAAGFVLAEGGGLAASAGVVAFAQAEASVAQARSAFTLPVVSGEASVVATAAAGAPASFASLSLGPVPMVDPRAQRYGSGIPLRARANVVTVAESSAAGHLSITTRARAEEITFTTNAALPPWQQLPAAAGNRAVVDVQQRRRDAVVGTMRWRFGR